MNGGAIDRGYGTGRDTMMKIRNQEFSFRRVCLRSLLHWSGNVRWVWSSQRSSGL